MTQRILIMGLPGAGKTYFAERLKKRLEEYIGVPNELSLRPIADAQVTVGWLNADKVRSHYNDWDEVVAECKTYAWSVSHRLQSVVKKECQ